MASERQIAANRENARKSTGPKTGAGKQRSSGNAYRYGLSLPIDEGEIAGTVESLVRCIVAGNTDRSVLEWARVAARAHLELDRIRQIKRDIIIRVVQFGALDVAALHRAYAAEARFVKRMCRQPLKKRKPIDCLPPEPSEAERVADAVQQLLAELRKLNRYEARAYVTMDRALQRI